MYAELSDEMIFIIVGAFMLGCILATMVNRANSDSRSQKRDPRDGRIRALEAELRVAKSVGEDSRTDVEKLQDELKETTVGVVRRDDVITQQQTKIQKVSSDLEKSVMKTHELRSELADRATQSLHAEAKIREVETELSVAHASTDLLSTGVLDYSTSPKVLDPGAVDIDEDDKPKRARKASS